MIHGERGDDPLAEDMLDGVDDFALLLGFSLKKTYHMLAKGQIPHVKIGRRYYGRKSEVRRTFSSVA